MERLRVKTPSPVPFKKTSSCGSLLDEIIGKKVTDLSASNGFGLALPYRQHHRKYKLPPSARSSGSLPNSPRARPRSASPLALTKSPSVSIEDFLPGSPINDAPVEVTDAVWSCRACPNSGPEGLERGADAFLVCRKCGATDKSPQLVSQVRSKNCPESEDKTKVADEPVADALAVELEAYANGPETADERRRRHLNAAGGSYVPKKMLKSNDMGGAQSSLDKAKARDVRVRMDGGRDANKKRAILRMVEAVFDQIPSLDKRVCKHIRLTALRIYGASVDHDRACGHQGCMISISARSNAVVGTCVVEHALHQLCSGTTYADGEAIPNAILAETAPEVSPQELSSSLARVKSLQLRHASANQRLQVSSAIGIIASWKPGECKQKCPPTTMPPPPPELQLPPSLVGQRDFGSGKPKSLAPEDRTCEKLRQRLLATAKLWRSPPQVRNHALEALTYKSIVSFLSGMGTADQGLPIDVLSIGLLLAAARCQSYPEEVPLFAQNIFDQYQLSASTVGTYVQSIAEVMMDTIESAPDDQELF